MNRKAKAPKRRTKKALQSEASIEAILEAAKYLFVTQGFRGTRTDDIANRVGLTKGAVYFHFEDKSAVLKTLLDQARDAVLKPLVDKVEKSTGTPSDRLIAFLHHEAYVASQDPAMLLLPIIIAIEFKGSEDKIGRYVHGGYQRVVRMLERVLREGMEAGEFRNDISPLEQAHVLVALNDGMMLTWLRNGQDLDGATLVRQVRCTLWRGISAPGFVKQSVKRNAQMPSVDLPIIQ